MRGLADELQVTPMALYAHVADKDEILDEVLDHVLRHTDLPGMRLGWSRWMIEFAVQLHDLLCAQPQLLSRYLRRPVGVRAALDRMESALDVLARAGFNDVEAVDIYASVHACTLGFTSLEVARRENGTTPASVRISMEPVGSRYWPAVFSTLDPETFPNLARIRPDLESFSGPDRFRHVIADLLAGHKPSSDAISVAKKAKKR